MARILLVEDDLWSRRLAFELLELRGHDVLCAAGVTDGRAQLDTVKCRVRWAKKEGEGVFVVGLMFDETPENLVRSWLKPVLTKLFQQKTKNGICKIILLLTVVIGP